MADVSWMPVAGAAVGAVIALTGTLAATVRTDRTQRSRDRESERLTAYVDFALAMSAALAGLRSVASSNPPPSSRASLVSEVMNDAGVYSVRERLLMTGANDLVRAAEGAFHRLTDIRNEVRGGAVLSDPGYHDAYHAFAEAMWEFRLAVRRERGQKALDAAALGRSGWTERDECPRCGKPS